MVSAKWRLIIRVWENRLKKPEKPKRDFLFC
jgi:hypothetical protein